VFGPFGPPGGPGFPGESPGASALRRRLGIPRIDELYVDVGGDTHLTPGEAIEANRRLEGDFSRGASGGCGQDPSLVPGGPNKK
jgi:hypothetical protein